MNDTSNDERMRILERIENGEISAAQGMALLEQLVAQPDVLQVDSIGAAPPPVDPDIARWKRWWMLPFAIGVGITVIAAALMLSAIQASGYGFWFYCLWLPFLAGVAVMALSWASRTSRWLHLRVNTGQDEWPRRIAFSFPIPVRLTAWLVRTISPYVPQLRNTALDEVILALDENTSDAAPFYVDVAEGERGERVQVYLG